MNTNNLVIGIVKDLDDRENLGRVRVEYPNLKIASNWARLAAPMAGAERGVFFRPEPEDEVVIAFLHGDVRSPYIVGGVWSSKDKPPPNDGDNKANNQKIIRTRSGHTLKFDDKQGKEKIEIIAKGEKHKIVIDVGSDKIQIIAASGDIEVQAKGTLRMQAQTVEIKATQGMKIEAGATLDIKGQTVNIN